MSAAKREPKTPDEWIVYTIRLLWSADTVNETPWTYPFGTGDESLTMEEADAAILDAFKAERPHHDDDLHTIWVLIRG